jgi:hypothetical protein
MAAMKYSSNVDTKYMILEYDVLVAPQVCLMAPQVGLVDPDNCTLGII